MRLKIAVCDDEVVFAEKLKKIISSYLKEKQISYEIHLYQSGKALLEDRIDAASYQIIFLDINMDDMNGIETARNLRELTGETYLIFVTAFIKYTLEGYTVDAVRYILKTNVCFEQSVFESLDAVLQKMAYQPCMKEFAFREGNRELSLEKILYVESNLHMLTFYVLDHGIQTYTMYETLNNISKLFPEDFVRAHQSYLVNTRYVKKFLKGKLTLRENMVLPVSRRYEKEVRRRVARCKGEV